MLTKNYLLSSTKSPCPVCGGTHGDKIFDNEVVFCLRETRDTLTHRFVKPLANGMGGLFVPKDYRYDPAKLPETEPRPATLSDTERDRQYRLLAAQLPLSEFHRQRLIQRRDLTADEVDWLYRQGFRSLRPGQRVQGVSDRLPGVRRAFGDVFQLNGKRGYIIPATKPDGTITGYQIATDSRLPKYVWWSNGDINRENGELPVFCALPPLQKRTENRYTHATLYFDGSMSPSVDAERRRMGTGTAGAGAVLIDDLGNPIASASKSFKNLTVAQAEYNGLILGLQLAVKHGIVTLDVIGNAELVINQVNELVEVTHPTLKPLHGVAIELLSNFECWQITHFPRERNLAHDYAVAGRQGTTTANAAECIDFREVILVDGAQKPYLTAIKRKRVVIGFGGGTQITASPQTLKEYLRDLSPDRVVHAPDAGDVANAANIPLANYDAHQLIERWGYDVKVAWWGQIKKSDGGDIDELAPDAAIDLITPDQFFDLHSHATRERILNRALPKRGVTLLDAPVASPHLVTYREPQRFGHGQRLQVLRSLRLRSRFGFDGSLPGLGKSSTIAHARPKDFGDDIKQIVHASPYATTSEPDWIHWPQYRGPDQGRVLAEDGRVVKAVSTDEDGLMLEANCIKGSWNDARQAKGLSTTVETRCVGCHLFESGECQSTPGKYHRDKETTLNSDRYRTVASGLFPETFKDSTGKAWGDHRADETRKPGTVLVIDDVSPFTVDTKVRLKTLSSLLDYDEFDQYLLDNAREVRLHLRSLKAALEAKKQLQHSELIAQLHPLPDGTNYAAIASIEESLVEMDEDGNFDRVWLADYFDALRNDGRVYCDDKGQLSIVQRNHRFFEAINHPAVAFVVFLDATMPIEHLESWLRPYINGQSIPFVAETEPTESADLDITQVTGCGDLGYRRTKRQRERLKALRQKFDQLHPERAEIDIKTEVIRLDADIRERVTQLIWRASSRGSNRARHEETLVLYGTPRNNLQAAIAEYCLMTGLTDIELGETESVYPIDAINAPAGKHYARAMREAAHAGFAAYYHQQTVAEIVQGLHRLRPLIRAGVKLNVYAVTEYPLPFPVRVVTADELLETQPTSDPLTRERLDDAIELLLRSGAAVSQQNVADTLAITRGKLTRFLVASGLQWERLTGAKKADRALIDQCTDQTLKTTSNVDISSTMQMIASDLYNDQPRSNAKCLISRGFDPVLRSDRALIGIDPINADDLAVEPGDRTTNATSFDESTTPSAPPADVADVDIYAPPESPDNDPSTPRFSVGDRVEAASPDMRASGTVTGRQWCDRDSTWRYTVELRI